MTERPGTTIVDVADVFGVHQADVSRILPLAFLSPEQSHRILTGQQTVELTARSLGRMDLPLIWNEQATVLDA